jgi:hypothetical protein
MVLPGGDSMVELLEALVLIGGSTCMGAFLAEACSSVIAALTPPVDL